MKHRQDKALRGGGHPRNKLLKGKAGIIDRFEKALSHLERRVPYLSGFSMMEILISCVIIGVLAVILIPTMQSAKPDKNEALHKKSTFVVERVINELSSDTQLYPNNGEYSSLSNTENVTYNNETHGGPTKFCTLFASRIKLKAGSEVSCIEGEKSFTSEDGIDWYLPVSDFKGGSETIMIDVNGSAGPNAIGEDRYEYKVQPGFKIPKKEIDEGAITNTPAAPVKEDPSAGVIPTGETKTSQAKYSINCNVLGGEASILGAGDNKVNGNYTLVAVPKAGYKCNWFTKQVTVKDGDVGNCDLSCEPDTLRPVQDGETNINEIPDEPLDFCVEHPDDPSCIPDHCEQHPDDPDCIPDYCASVNWSGSSEYCSDSGKVCGKPGTKYNITIKSSNKNYKAQFTQGQGSGTFGNSNVVLQASCNPSNKCYNMYLTGDSNCPYTTPEENCPYPNVPGYTNGTYNITVNAKDGYTFNGKEGTSTYQIKINGSNVTKDLTSLCKKSGSDKITINVTAEDMNSGTGWFSMSSSSEMPEAVSSTLTSNVEIWDDRWPNSSGQLVPEVNTATVTIAKGQTKSATQPAHTTVTGVDRFLNASAIVSMGGKTVSTSVSGPYEFSRNGVAYTVEYDIQGGSPPRKQCKVTMQNSSGGTTTPAGGTTTSVDCGFPLTITAKANSGYKFSTWEKVSGNGSFRNAKTASTTFTPTSDSTIKATFTGGTGKIKVTLKSDGSGCSHGTYMDIMKATVVARGNNKNYTINIGPSNPPMSGTVSVPAGNYVLTNTAFDPTLSCMAGDCSTYEEIKVLSLSPTNVTVPANGTAEATLLVGCNGIGNTCAINLIGDGGFGGQVNAEVKLSGGASKSATLNSSNGYKATWSGLTCGKQYTVSATAVLSSSANKEAWADAVLSATADPSRFTLQAKQDVYIKIKDSAPPKDCSINVEGTGDTGNGVFADIKLSGGENKTATLSESNKYVVTWSDLTCGKSYTVSVTKAGEKKSGAVTTTKVTATVNPSGSFSLPSGTKNVTVNLKKENNACDPSNTYTVQVTETQNEAEISQIENFLKSMGHNEYSGISIPAGGPWYGARNPRLSRDGYGTIKGGDSVDIVFNKPTFEVNVPAGQGNYHYSSYVKSVTVNGEKQGSTSSYYKDKVCEDMNIVVEYSLKNTGVGTDLVDVVIQYFVDNVLKTTTDDKQAVSRGGTYSMTAPETYQNATFKNWQAIVNSNTNAGSGSSTSVSVKNVSGPLTIKLNYANAKQCKVNVSYEWASGTQLTGAQCNGGASGSSVMDFITGTSSSEINCPGTFTLSTTASGRCIPTNGATLIFKGWYDSNGSLLSSNQSYGLNVTTDKSIIGRWSTNVASSAKGTINVKVSASNSGTQITSANVLINGAYANISDSLSAGGAPYVSKSYSASAGSYTVQDSTATIKTDGKTVSVPITWSPKTFTLKSGGSQAVTGTINYTPEAKPLTISYKLLNASDGSANLSNCSCVLGSATLSGTADTYYSFSAKVTFSTPGYSIPGGSGPYTFSGIFRPGQQNITSNIWCPPPGYNDPNNNSFTGCRSMSASVSPEYFRKGN